MQPTYIIVSQERGAAIVPHRHTEYEAALGEARRLAARNPDDVFDVFVSITRVSAPKVIVEQYDRTDDGIPF